MRTFTNETVAAHAFVVQERAFYWAVPPALAFIVLALLGEERLAMAAALLDVFALGASVGAWIVARRFKG